MQLLRREEHASALASKVRHDKIGGVPCDDVISQHQRSWIIRQSELCHCRYSGSFTVIKVVALLRPRTWGLWLSEFTVATGVQERKRCPDTNSNRAS
jgi:hypothetical protein